MANGYGLAVIAAGVVAGYVTFTNVDCDDIVDSVGKDEVAEPVSAQQAHEAFYGTLKNPAFDVVSEAPEFKPASYCSSVVPLLDRRIHFLEQVFMDANDSRWSVVSEYLEGLEETIDRHGVLSMPSDVRDVFLQAYTSFADVYREITGVSRTLLEEDLERMIAFSATDAVSLSDADYDVVFQDVSSAFLGLTGKVVPVSLAVGDLDSEGAYDTAMRSIVADRGSYERTFTRLAHMLGCISCQVDDDARYAGGITREVEIMEYACAFAFRTAMIAEMSADNGHRSDCSILNSISLSLCIDRYFKGDDEPQNEGAAISDAATSYFGNAHDAYRYLSRHSYGDLDPAIRSGIEKYKSKFVTYHSLFDSYLEFTRGFDPIVERFDRLRSIIEVH